MCGIFGLILAENSDKSDAIVKKLLTKIAKISIARGQDSSGLAFKSNQISSITVIKGDIPINCLLKESVVKQEIDNAIKNYQNGDLFQVIGHARLVTNGSQLKDVNNQPVVKDGIVGIHNGIIVNDKKLWQENQEIERKYEIDTEVILSLIKRNIIKGSSLSNAIIDTLNKIEGTASCALLFEDNHHLALFTNNGSIYYSFDNEIFLFASEEYFMKETLRKCNIDLPIVHLKANSGAILNTKLFQITEFSSTQTFSKEFNYLTHSNYTISIKNIKSNFNKEFVVDPSEFINKSKESGLLNLLENNIDNIVKLKRCSKCILPETFPFIEFDRNGQCNYCKNHKAQKQIQNFDALKNLIKPYKRKDGRPDCIVPFSGGRDSTYTLHIVKKELGLNPVAFTYDWGMVTDLARRNIARVCGKLGVENIVVSADIKWKRENIRKNIEAWLKHPDLGMIPLFMAGDKYFFHYCNQVKQQTGIALNIWGINNLENTNFKTGFAGLPPQFNKKRIYSLSLINQLKLFGFVGKNLIQSPGYINQSIVDSLGSFAVRYLSPKKDYYHLFDYYKWDENELEQLIRNEYNWEKSIDTDSTWRIGDGTASFYNYIYYTVAGFTENDTFRSNQIREGLITREDALSKINKENEVRYETMRWYLEIIGIDFKNAIETINAIPKLYSI